MVKDKLRFHGRIAGPYSMFSDTSGQFTVGREVSHSSHSSEVSELVSKVPRFSSWSEYSSRYTLEHGEYASIEDVDFGYVGHIDEPMYTATKIFGTVINVFGGWRDFIRDVRSASGGTISMDIGFDDDGVDYDRMVEYSVKMALMGSETERLMKLEGINLWD